MSTSYENQIFFSASIFDIEAVKKSPNENTGENKTINEL